MSKGIGGAPVKVVWTREDDIHNGFYHTVSAERLEAGLDKDGKVIAWRHNSVAPTIFSLFAPDPKLEAPLEQGMGLVDVAIRNQEYEYRERRGRGAHQDRLVPLRLEYSARVRDPILHRRIGRGGRQGSTNLHPQDLIGPARIVDVRKTVKDFWDYSENPDTYPIDTGGFGRKVVELVTTRRQGGMGSQVAAGPRPRLSGGPPYNREPMSPPSSKRRWDDKGTVSTVHRGSTSPSNCGPTTSIRIGSNAHKWRAR